MTQEEAHILVAEYQRTGSLPKSFEADHNSFSSIQGDKHEIVYIRQGSITLISYVIENGKVLNIDLV